MQLFRKIYETMSNRWTAKSHSIIPSANKTDDNLKFTKMINESLQSKIRAEPNTNPTDSTQQKPLQIRKSSCSEKFTGGRSNPAVELQQQFSELFSSEQTQTANERLRLQHQQRIEAPNQLLRKQELERSPFLQQLNQLDTEVQHDDIPSKKLNWHLQHQNSYHHIKLQDLSFPLLQHSSFMLLQKDKNEHLL